MDRPILRGMEKGPENIAILRAQLAALEEQCLALKRRIERLEPPVARSPASMSPAEVTAASDRLASSPEGLAHEAHNAPRAMATTTAPKDGFMRSCLPASLRTASIVTPEGVCLRLRTSQRASDFKKTSRQEQVSE